MNINRRTIDRYLKYIYESESERVSAKGIIILNNKILILRIQNDCGGEGKWDLPGGGIENGETPEDALRREVKEETNLDLLPDTIKSLNVTKKFIIPEDGVHSKWKFYRAIAKNGDIKFNPSHWKKLQGQSEHNEYKWISNLSELNNIEMADEMKSVLKSELKKLNNE